MPYLLDTNTCVEYLRNRNQLVVQRLRATPPDQVRLCSVVLGELHYGAHRSARPADNLALIATFVAPFSCLSFDAAAAEEFGRVRTSLAAAGFPIGPYDLQIAAIALVNRCTLVTHNTTEFGRVPGLQLEDWQATP